jgi:hypothetical protein
MAAEPTLAKDLNSKEDDKNTKGTDSRFQYIFPFFFSVYSIVLAYVTMDYYCE